MSTPTPSTPVSHPREVTVGDFYKWSLVVDRGGQAILKAGKPPPGVTDIPHVDQSDQFGLRVITDRMEISLRPTWLASVQEYRGLDPARSPAFFTLFALAESDFDSLPLPQLVRCWRTLVARSRQCTEATVDALPLTTFSQLLLSLRTDVQQPEPPTPLSGRSIPAVARHGHISPKELPAGLREAYATVYLLVMSAGVAEHIHRGLSTLGTERSFFSHPSPLLQYPDPANELATALAKIDRFLAVAERELAPVRWEFVSCRSGWALDLAPTNNVHDTGVWFATAIRGKFDELMRYITGDRRGFGSNYLPSQEFVRRWPEFSALVWQLPDLFKGLPNVMQVLLELSREATLAAAARPEGIKINLGDKAQPDIPEWRERHRRLLFRGVVIRDFSAKKGKNQEAILDAFQADGWPPAVRPKVKDHTLREPIPLTGRALTDAIDGLNERVTPGTIWFSGDGTGEGVRWEVIVASPITPEDLEIHG